MIFTIAVFDLANCCRNLQGTLSHKQAIQYEERVNILFYIEELFVVFIVDRVTLK